MSIAKFRIANRGDEFLHNTIVENLFINELLPAAPGEYVKLFLFGLMYAQLEQELSVEMMAKALSMTEAEVAQGWSYWERQGAVILETTESDVSIEFVRQIERYYGRHTTKTSSTNDVARSNINQADTGTSEPRLGSEVEDRMASLIDQEIRALYSDYEEMKGKSVSPVEMNKIVDLVKVYNVAPDVISYAIKYCGEIEKYSIDYIAKVAMRWSEEGCRSISDVKEYLDKYSKRNAYYGRIFKEMGFTRLPSPADRDMMGRWFDEMGYSIGEVIEACRKTAGQREPSLKYVNKILENKLLEAGGINTRPKSSGYETRTQDQAETKKEQQAKVSNKVLAEYYEYLRKLSEREQDARIDEVCGKLVEMREIFSEENKLNEQLLNFNFASRSKINREEMKLKRQELEQNKRRILRENGYSESYLDRKYKCSACNDTGETREGVVCACRAARANEAYEWITKRK